MQDDTTPVVPTDQPVDETPVVPEVPATEEAPATPEVTTEEVPAEGAEETPAV